MGQKGQVATITTELLAKTGLQIFIKVRPIYEYCRLKIEEYLKTASLKISLFELIRNTVFG